MSKAKVLEHTAFMGLCNGSHPMRSLVRSCSMKSSRELLPHRWVMLISSTEGGYTYFQVFSLPELGLDNFTCVLVGPELELSFVPPRLAIPKQP